MSDERCKGEFYGDGRWPRKLRCSKRATRDGFCGTHHPDAVARREKERTERYVEKQNAFQREWDGRKEQRRRAECFPDLLAALKAMSDQFQFTSINAGDDEANALAHAAIAKAEGHE